MRYQVKALHGDQVRKGLEETNVHRPRLGMQEEGRETGLPAGCHSSSHKLCTPVTVQWCEMITTAFGAKSELPWSESRAN